MDDDKIGKHEVNVRDVSSPDLDEEELLRRKDEAIRQFLDALMLLRSYIPLNHLITVPLLASVTFIKALNSVGILSESDDDIKESLSRAISEAVDGVEVKLQHDKVH